MSFRALVKKLIPRALFVRVEPYGHWLEAIVENVLFGFPARKLKVIGVTGTAGKTTTCTLLTHMLRHSNYKVAMMTTISVDYGDGKGARPNTTRMTSVGSLKLIKAVKRMLANNVEWLVLETTSQALAQHRVWGVPYTVVGFTNLSHDNIDYHGSFENYRAAKVRLFTQCNRNRRGLRTGVVNADDPNADYFIRAIKHPVTYGIQRGDLRAHDIRQLPNGSQFVARIGDDEYHVTSHLPGAFNVYNCLAAIGIARSVGLTIEQIEQGITGLEQVNGRMNEINEGQDFGVIVDYAPTPVAFTNVFDAVEPIVKGRIIVVFGSAGRRDNLKRPIQGEIAGKRADIVILTEEDDRDQDGLKIMEEIAAGAVKAGKVKEKDLFLIHDRAEAVERAITMAKKDDMVLILGKGEETVIITNKPGHKTSPGHIYNEDTDTVRRPYNDSDTARSVLRKLAKTPKE